MSESKVTFINDDVAYTEATAQMLEEAAKMVRTGDIKLALCTLITRQGDPIYITRGNLHSPQECLAASGMLNYHNHLIMELMHRLMAKANEQEETNGNGADQN